VRRAVTEWPPDVEGLEHAQRAMAAAYLLARFDGEPVGCGMSSVFPGLEAAPFIGADVSVVPAYRRRGIGDALLRAVSEQARALAKEGLQLEVREDDADSIRFVERRGFRELERQLEVVLDLTSLEATPPVDPPAGIAIVSRAERPDLERAQYELEQEAGRDIPGLDAEGEQTFEEWRSFAIERPGADPALSFLALAGDRLVGSASIVVSGGNAYHGLTAVAREWRGRGVATALKRSQIAAAFARGHRRLVTESQQDNLPMRRLNEKLGYEPSPGMIVYRGPLLVA
jgi:GNAT superfamily N-acetyltransferase